MCRCVDGGCVLCVCFFFKQKTAYEVRISDWSSDVCSSDLEAVSGLLDGLVIETLLSHLACADEDHVLNTRQLERFSVLRSKIAARRYSLANSAGICLGPDYAFDLTRPGLALYGGIPRELGRASCRERVCQSG